MTSLIIPPCFYQTEDVLDIGHKAPEGKASHAYGMRRTKRNEVMYRTGGVAYVYLCYGKHALLRDSHPL